MIVLDTNVLSEPGRPLPSPRVAAWLRRQPRHDLYTTTISVAELLTGVARLPAGRRRDAIRIAVEGIIAEMEWRILPFDEAAARAFPEIAARRRKTGRPIALLDALIAAISRSHGAAVATRDVRGFADCGVAVVNPWEHPAE